MTVINQELPCFDGTIDEQCQKVVQHKCKDNVLTPPKIEKPEAMAHAITAPVVNAAMTYWLLDANIGKSV